MATLTIEQHAKTQVLSFSEPAPLSALLESAGFHGMQPCGGRGVCGKCAVTLSGCVSAPNDAEKRAGVRLACQVQILGDAHVILPEQQKMEQIQTGTVDIHRVRPMDGNWGAVVDIGTTTIVLQVYNLNEGTFIGEAAMQNPQASVAADVMGRIGAAMDGQLRKLSIQVQDAISKLLTEVCGDLTQNVDLLVITGNTTMLFLLTKTDPTCLSRAPFKADTLFDTYTDILERKTYLPPCMNAFVGADITCAVLASGMCENNRTALLCDVGTNGEIALWKDGILHVTSTAAGPAFEGAGISCGCGSIRGAIDRVWVEDNTLSIHTIGDAPAVGICGSGLIDAIAALLELEILDETGALEDDEVILANGVTLLQRDIRAVQLAKAAIAAGIKTLLEEAGVTYQEIETFYIAGGFGSHLNISNAAAIGLFPAELQKNVQVLGNAALTGAAQLMLDKTLLTKSQKFAATSVHCNLGGNPTFNNYYMEQMLFPIL